MCSDRKTYSGCTDDLKDRVDRHTKGQVPATEERLPVKLISYFAFSDKYIAYNFEKYLKSGSGRTFLKKHDITDQPDREQDSNIGTRKCDKISSI